MQIVHLNNTKKCDIILTEGCDIMALSEARKKANKKWNDKNMSVKYDHIHLTTPKGKKDAISAHAAERGESVNAFINRAIDETIERDGAAKSDL